MLNLFDRVDTTLRRMEYKRFHHTPGTPHYHLVPKDEKGNRKWRRYCLDLGTRERKHARRFWEMCRDDILFYANTFCYTFAPKDHPNQPNRPFITYPYQDDAILRIAASIGDSTTSRDVAIPKSRDMGATWLCLLVLEHRWHFFEGQTFLLVSRKEEYVDKRGAPKELFWKVDYMHRYQPPWLLPPGRELGRDDPNRIKMHLENMETNSVIDGEATVKDLARGDRLTAILLDEHASMKDGPDISKSTRDASNCRICNSTPKGTSGTGGEFYRFVTNPATEVIVLHWSLHPVKGNGLYTCDPVSARVTKYDKYRFPRGYPFIADGRMRSPWYDRECSRSTSTAEIAQELDIDFLRTGHPFFNPIMVERLMAETTRPTVIGWVDLSDDGEFRIADGDRGPMRVWCPLRQGEDGVRRPAHSRYVVGCDIAMGTGGSHSSNSVASVFDVTLGRKVAEYASNEIPPLEFATLAVAMAKWFHNAGLIWESNGFGGAFGKKVVRDLGYGNIYLRRTTEMLTEKRTRKPGWWSGRNEKRLLLSQYAEALNNGKYRNCSKEALMECHEYIHSPDQTIIHDKSRGSDNSTEVGENHGDRVIADALTWRMAMESGEYRPAATTVETPRGSFAHRRMEWEKSRLLQGSW